MNYLYAQKFQQVISNKVTFVIWLLALNMWVIPIWGTYENHERKKPALRLNL